MNWRIQLLKKQTDKEFIYEIKKEFNIIKDLISNKNLKEIAKDSEIIRLLDFSIIHISDLIEFLSDYLRKNYPSKMWLELENIGKRISLDDVHFDEIWQLLSSKDFSEFQQLINSLITKEQYDFTELDRIERLKKAYNLSNNYNENNLNSHQESPLMEQDIQEITKEESRKYGQFKIKEVSYGSEENEEEEFSLTEFLCFKNEDGEWIDSLYSSIKEREFDYEHGRVRNRSGYSLQRVMYVDIEDLVYYIENDAGVLFCSIDRKAWYRYNVELKERPYYNRIDKLRKFIIPN